ncbi:hypothetical protein CFB84_13620 [Burkholderia aenigmatica]|uniref:Uncharacterized protein n=1 Tax=Burkholderia aenigmatica TaxID=2015348 RepID=A0A228I301_9BURK|nr:hypothetical protein CFB84_32800 [Burkholderia aenigmatica]OXI45872.1 hypothetical protein CFB84_13620 [Burkholderia aenigmatica]
MTGRCFYCPEPATLLCDHRFGWPIGGFAANSQGRYLVKAAAAPFTCDMPLCSQHAGRIGGVHFRTGRRGYFDSIDLCPEHVGHAQLPADPMTAVEAERLRQAVRDRARRRLADQGSNGWTPPAPTVQGELF